VSQIEQKTKVVISRFIRVAVEVHVERDLSMFPLSGFLSLLKNNKIDSVDASWIAAALWARGLDCYMSAPCWLGRGFDCSFEHDETASKWLKCAMLVSRFVGDDGALENRVGIFV
jgi:hypothetical protein